jgi:glycosyltransferase involved in cell wall biosynthesis
MVQAVHYLRRVRLEDGGVVRAVLDFCRVFAAAGNPTILVTCDAADVPAAWRVPGAIGVPKVLEVDPPRGRLGLWGRAAKSQFVAAVRGADVLHLHGVWEPTNVQAGAAARAANVPYLISAHGMLDDWSMAQRRLKKRAYLALVGNRLFRGAAAVHFTAQGELDQGAKWVPPGKGVVLPLIVDLSAFAELPGPGRARDTFSGLCAGRPTLLFLSRLHPKKGVELLIEAGGLLARSGRAYQILIAGPGDEGYVDRLRGLVDHCGMSGQVDFLGMVRGADKLSLIQAADAFVLPTSQENFGLVLIEALACRARVVTTRGVDIWRELQEAGATIVEPSAEALASAIDSMPAAPSVDERGREWVLRTLDPARLVEAYGELYQQMTPARNS